MIKTSSRHTMGGWNDLWQMLDRCLEHWRPNPLQWWQILNIRSFIMSPTGCPWPCLLSSGVFNHCFNPSRSLSVPAAWCIFTSAIDYQTIFDDYSSSPWWRHPPPSLHAPYQDRAQSLPIRGLMDLTNQRSGNCLVSMTWSYWRRRKMKKWWYINMSMHLQADSNRVMGQFRT